MLGVYLSPIVLFSIFGAVLLLRENQALSIYTISLLSQRVYVVNSIKLIHAVHRNHKALQYAPLASSFTANLAGCSLKTTQILKRNADLKDGHWGLYHDSLTAIHNALAPGKGLDKSNLAMMKNVFQSCETLNKEEDRIQIELISWVRHVVTSATSEGIYGPQSPLRHAENEELFWTFEEQSTWLLPNFIPNWIAARGNSARTALAKEFEKYFRGDGHRGGSDVVNVRYDTCRKHGIPVDDVARLEVVGALAALANTVPAAFWMLYHVYSSQPALIQSLRQELEQNILTTSSMPDSVVLQRVLDFTQLKERCPLLTAIYQESLRLQSYYVFVRGASDDTDLVDQYLLRKGAIVHMPNRRAHTDPEIWGEDAREFNPYRFLRSHPVNATAAPSTTETPASCSSRSAPTPTINVKSAHLRQEAVGSEGQDQEKFRQERQQVQPPGAAFLVFGSGKNTCPGRHFAGMQIMSLVALLVMRFDLSPPSSITNKEEVLNREGRSSKEKYAWPPPQITLDKISSAIMFPAGQFWVNVRRRPGYEGGVWKARLGDLTEP